MLDNADGQMSARCHAELPKIIGNDPLISHAAAVLFAPGNPVHTVQRLAVLCDRKYAATLYKDWRLRALCVTPRDLLLFALSCRAIDVYLSYGLHRTISHPKIAESLGCDVRTVRNAIRRTLESAVFGELFLKEASTFGIETWLRGWRD
jgi:hypothetical protein